MSSGTAIRYVAVLSIAALPDASVATMSTLYAPGAPTPTIVPIHRSSPASASKTPSAVTLAMPDLSSVTVTVTVIDSPDRRTSGSSTTEVIIGGVVSSSTCTVYVAESSVALLAFSELSVATTVTLCTPDALSAVISPSHMSFSTSASGVPLAVTLAMPDSSSVTVTVTVTNPFGATSVGLSTTEDISGGVVPA
uniref:Uncharacterized protein n=1 Tax=Candidatus Methanogaster sp. ANME-2c ERB4 TaxID=2759911 RepID=A0A7G9YKG8_9EURY|nr:hypothetical protein IMNOINEI_00002 [Methanosarcinales archaeon ANME-2c ERB4]